MSERKSKRNYNELLIWAAALVTVVRYSAAFVASDMGQITGEWSEAVTIALGLSGLGMGILDVIGGAALFQGWRKVMPKSGQPWPFRFKVLTFFVFGLILNGIIVIVPFTVSRVMQESMLIALGGGFWVWFWAAAVNVAPYMLIGGVSVSSNLVDTGNAEQGANQTRTKSEQGANQADDGANIRRSFAGLTESERLFIINSDSKTAAQELNVTPRAIQKWRKRIGAEMKAGDK